MNRRMFVKRTGQAALALGIGEVTMGVSCETVFTDIMNYVPIGLTAFQTIVTLINPVEGSIVAGLVTMVKAALADVQEAVTAYNNAPAANKATLEGKISTAIAAAEQVLQQFWSDLKLPDGNLATLVEGVINIILSTLASFLPQLPAPAASTKAVKPLARSITFVAKKRSLKQFKTDLNTQFTATGYSPIFK